MSLLKSLTLLFCLIGFGATHAALAPNHNASRKLGEMYYAQQDREAAADVITLRVNRVVMAAEEGDGCPQVDAYTVDATVESVERGALSAGDTIHITYRNKYYLWALRHAIQEDCSRENATAPTLPVMTTTAPWLAGRGAFTAQMSLMRST